MEPCYLQCLWWIEITQDESIANRWGHRLCQLFGIVGFLHCMIFANAAPHVALLCRRFEVFNCPDLKRWVYRSTNLLMWSGWLSSRFIPISISPYIVHGDIVGRPDSSGNQRCIYFSGVRRCSFASWCAKDNKMQWNPLYPPINDPWIEEASISLHHHWSEWQGISSHIIAKFTTQNTTNWVFKRHQRYHQRVPFHNVHVLTACGLPTLRIQWILAPFRCASALWIEV